jgi:hypothetical protein
VIQSDTESAGNGCVRAGVTFSRGGGDPLKGWAGSRTEDRSPPGTPPRRRTIGVNFCPRGPHTYVQSQMRGHATAYATTLLPL